MDDDTPNLSNFTTAHAAAVVVLGALVFLILVRRGFRGVVVPGVGGVGLS